MRWPRESGEPAEFISEIRAEYGARQAELLRALVAGSRLPQGFDAGRARAVAEVLVRKRGGAVAKAWPVLAVSLRASFDTRFADYAAEHPLSTESDAMGDGLAFGRWLQGRGSLDDAARLELLLARTRYVLRAGRASRRRAPFIGALRARHPARIAVVLYVPVLGTGVVEVPVRCPWATRARAQP